MTNTLGFSRVSIPNNVRKTIQNIKEVTQNHSDEDIYAMLKDCSMDPNETTQKLLHLDTFHEVKRKRDKRKENVKSRPVEFRGKVGYHGRGSRDARGSSYSQYSFNDAGGRRNAAIRKENGIRETSEKGFRQSPVTGSKDVDPTQPLHVDRSSALINEPVTLSNGSLSDGHGAQYSGVTDTSLSKVNIEGSTHKASNMPRTSAEHAPSASDPVLVPSHDSQISTSVGDSEAKTTGRGMHTPESISGDLVIKNSSDLVEELEVSPIIKKEALENLSVAQPNGENIHSPDRTSVVKSSSPLMQDVEDISKMEKLKISDGQHVIIPNHIQVPDAVKSSLSFGSLDVTNGVRENGINGESYKNSSSAAHSVLDETASKLSSCDQEADTVPEGNHLNQLQTPPDLPPKKSPLEPKVSSTAVASNQLKEDHSSAVGPPFPVVQTTPNYSFGFVPPILVNPPVQSEGFEFQAHVSNSLAGSSPAMSTSSTPPAAQSIGVGQSSVTASLSSTSLLRQPYPPNLFPYNHYYSQFYIPPTMPQYFGHTAFAPPPPGTMYLPSPVASTGMKISPTSYKTGANAGNQVPIGVPSGFGVYNSTQVGFNPNPSVTLGNSSTTEGHVPSALKENNIYAGQQSEGSTVWVPTAGRETANFAWNTLLNVVPPQPQGQHMMTNPHQSGGHGGAFMYHTMQPPMASPPPLLQQSQPMVGPPHPNWNV